MEILGIDIGGSGIKSAVVDIKKGKLVTDRYRVNTPQPPIPKNILPVIYEITKYFKWKGLIGCGFPAAIKNNIIRTASNIDPAWIGKNGSEEIKKVTNCKALLINDVDAAGYAEVNFGAGKGIKGTLIVTAFGTGIGSAVYTQGILLPNTELGHLKINGMIAEHYSSNAVRKEKGLDWKEFGGRINKYLNHIEFLFWPDLIIVGGGVSKKWGKFNKEIKCLTKVLPAQLENNAGIIGSAIAAGQHFS